MNYPKKTNLWRDKHIQGVKESLPKDVSFGSLTPGGRTSFRVSVETVPTPGQLLVIAEHTTEALRDEGIPVDHLLVKAGRDGRPGAVVQFSVQMEEYDG